MTKVKLEDVYQQIKSFKEFKATPLGTPPSDKGNNWTEDGCIWGFKRPDANSSP
jgi:hypothetical protein